MRALILAVFFFVGTTAFGADMTIRLHYLNGTVADVNVGKVLGVAINYTRFVVEEAPVVTLQYTSRVDNTAVTWSGYWGFNTLADAELIKSRLIGNGTIRCQGKQMPTNEFAYHIIQCSL